LPQFGSADQEVLSTVSIQSYPSPPVIRKKGECDDGFGGVDGDRADQGCVFMR
jgi:hypothetical protein